MRACVEEGGVGGKSVGAVERLYHIEHVRQTGNKTPSVLQRGYLLRELVVYLFLFLSSK